MACCSSEREESTPLVPFGASNSFDELPPATKKSFCASIKSLFCKEPVFYARTIPINGEEAPPPTPGAAFPPNVIRNQKYRAATFLFVTLYEQFKSFINFYYLILTLSQFIPVLRVGPIFTYAAPLAFVVGLSIAMEAYLDIRRMLRDREVNGEEYNRLTSRGLVKIKAADIKVGHFIQIETNRRIPADMILLRSSNPTGASFIRTDQLDGETDWKLRKAVPQTQKLQSDSDLFSFKNATAYAEQARKDIYKFQGNFNTDLKQESLSLENTLWASTVLASDTCIGLVIYTGRETRSVINTSIPDTKEGILDTEVNRVTMVMCIFQLILGFSLVVAGLFKGIWWLNYFRFLVLVSAAIPISMSVNLDLAKFVYAFLVVIDKDIPGCVVRNTTIPEEMGRISYLLSDKTGTLTQNDMIFKRLNLGSLNFSADTVPELKNLLHEAYGFAQEGRPVAGKGSYLRKNAQISSSAQVSEAIHVLALCHTVTPVKSEESEHIEYQASSPDEVALVKFTEDLDLTLWERDLFSITLKNPNGGTESFDILNEFPFSSERKRMGIILRNRDTNEIRFYMKGADTVMQKIVVDTEQWLAEECDNLAREGLRTLVFGQKTLSDQDYEQFQHDYEQASLLHHGRDEAIAQVLEDLEQNLELVGLTGVEDKLQEDVRATLEVLRNAGIKIWMLTGDKRETATCIAISSKLAAREHSIHQMACSNLREAEHQVAEFGTKQNTVLVIDGASLQFVLDHLRDKFFESAKSAPAVVCCRCSPTQKAEVVKMIRGLSGLQCAAIGDGGNDVSMIQAANIGFGIVGKEGRQASLAADYSILQFSHIRKLLLWHGRNSYLNSAAMSQCIIARGCCAAFMQWLYSAIFYFSPVVLFSGMMALGISMWYTMFPIFIICINQDVTEEAVSMYPELYQELRKGRALSGKTMALWLLVCVYQASTIMFLTIFVDLDKVDFVAITFTCLVFVQLFNVAMLITKWHILIILSEAATVAIYPLLIVFLPSYYHLQVVSSWRFWLQVGTILFVSTFPILGIRWLSNVIEPPAHKKVNE